MKILYVMRSISWRNEPTRARSAFRIWHGPHNRYGDLGFRITENKSGSYVFRSGSWYANQRFARAAARNRNFVVNRFNDYSFRLVEDA